MTRKGADPRKDQLRAAAAEAVTRMWEDKLISSNILTVSDDGPEWAKQIGERIRRAFTTRGSGIKLVVCDHVSSPTVLLVEAWNPDVVLCVACAQAGYFPKPSATEELTCDQCGAVDDHIHRMTSQRGPLLIIGGLCCRCHNSVGGFQCPGRSN